MHTALFYNEPADYASGHENGCWQGIILGPMHPCQPRTPLLNYTLQPKRSCSSARHCGKTKCRRIISHPYPGSSWHKIPLVNDSKGGFGGNAIDSDAFPQVAFRTMGSCVAVNR